MIFTIDQLVIICTGVPAVAITQLGRPRLQRWAPVLGMLGQPAWIWASIHPTLQIGMFIVNTLYCAAWGRGIWTHWLKRQQRSPHA